MTGAARVAAAGVARVAAAGVAGAGGAAAGAELSTWTGGFAEREVGIRLQSDSERSHVPLESLVGVALRRNPKRAQLLVSTVLAKHVPTEPGLVIVAAELLGLLVAGELDGRRSPEPLFARLSRILQPPHPAPSSAPTATSASAAPAAGADTAAQPEATAHAETAALRAEVAGLRSEHPQVVTIGYAETATGLGQLVAETIGSRYIHSTRLAPADAETFAGFEEEHSHATSHQLYPADPAWLRPGGTVVLVDDELSTGRTIVNTIRALHAAVPQARWVVASLIDLRSPDDRRSFDDLAAALGTSIASVALAAGSIALPPDAPARAARALARAVAAAAPAPAHSPAPALSRAGAAPGDPRAPASTRAPAPAHPHAAKGRESSLPATGGTIAAPSREAEPLDTPAPDLSAHTPPLDPPTPATLHAAKGRESSLPTTGRTIAAPSWEVEPLDTPSPDLSALSPPLAPPAPAGLHAAKGRESSLPESGGTITAPSREADPLGRVTVLEVGAEAPPSARFGIDARPLSAADTARAAAAAVARALVGTAAAKQAAGRGVVSEGTGGTGAERQDAPTAGSTAGGEDGGAAEVLVLGSEEFISVPLAIADELGGGGARAGARAGRVRFSTTTRSPIAPLDRADYAIASAITFQSHDRTHDGFGARFAYNLTRGGWRFDAIVFVPEPEADRERMLAPDGVVEALRRVTDHVIVAHLTPHEPRTEAAPSQPLPGTAPAPATTAAAPAPDERRLP